MNCPACHSSLRSGKNDILWFCPSCSGCTVRISALRARAPGAVVDALWNAARDSPMSSARVCMACERAMAIVTLPLASGATAFLDVCTACALVWFDASELGELLAAAQPTQRTAEAERRTATSSTPQDNRDADDWGIAELLIAYPDVALELLNVLVELAANAADLA